MVIHPDRLTCSSVPAHFLPSTWVFRVEWKVFIAIKYFFVQFKCKPMCVICNEIVSVKNEYNIKRHYDTKCAETNGDYTGDRRAEKLVALRRYTFKY